MDLGELLLKDVDHLAIDYNRMDKCLTEILAYLKILKSDLSFKIVGHSRKLRLRRFDDENPIYSDFDDKQSC